MNQVWTCPICLKTEKTTSRVTEVRHTHNNEGIRLLPYKKPRKPVGMVTIKSLKKEVWDIFSEYRRRKFANSSGFCKCVTCGKSDRWENMDAGHYIHGTLFLIEEIVWPQCKQCNGFKSGMAVEYRKFLVKELGENAVLYYEREAKKPHRYSIYELKQYKILYSQKLKELKSKG